ncbi:MAG: cupredoxin domain-containing protein, partial [Planctomycetes bacterium]|nr:cupredoxin domain-containing protein [Planctomycetota bacterium]
RQWNFDPDNITVNEGDTVILNINSIDVTHGFAIQAFGINERLSPGNTVRVEFVADRKGSFSFFCTVQCGAGHTGMRGT